MRKKRILSAIIAVAMVCTSIPVSNVSAGQQDVSKSETTDLASTSKFDVVFDATTGGITSMKLDNDPNKGNEELELNWVNGTKNTSGNGVNFGDTTWGMGPLYNGTQPSEQNITDTKSDVTFQTDKTKVNIVRELINDKKAIEETYAFTNTTNAEVSYKEGDLGIYVPFNDLYEASNLATQRRCNTHVWAGKDYSYIYALRMGGDGPHVGMVLTQGSMESYGQVGYQRSNSNDRGKFIFNNGNLTLKPGETYTVSWKIFAHNGEEDFYQKLEQESDFVRLESDFYTKEKDKNEGFSITATGTSNLEGATLQARSVKYRNKAAESEFPEDDKYTPVYSEPINIPVTISENTLSATFQPEAIGEYVVELTTLNGKKAICKLNYVSSMENLIKNRVIYVMDHQQMMDESDPDRYGGFFPYNTVTGELELNSGSSDHSGSRERLSMPIELALYYQMSTDEALKARIKERLELFWEYAKREILNIETGECFDTINYTGNGREYNYPNFAWMCVEMYKVTGKTECLDTMVKIFRYLKKTFGRRTAYIINMYMPENLELLYKEERYDDYMELYEYFIQCGDWIVEDLPNYPSLEVKYEQSIVSPTVENIAAVYYLTGDEKYKDAVETHYKRMLALEGNQPSYFQNKIGIRHWDDYWFGADDNTCGDTLHYWSDLDARAFKIYDMGMGTDHSKEIKTIFMNNLANFSEDGRGYCAYLISKQNNNIHGERYNQLANDQDYGMALALKNYIMPTEEISRKYIIKYDINNLTVQNDVTRSIVKDGDTLAGQFPNPEVEDNRILSWNTSKDGTGEVITETSEIHANMILYAQWEHPVGDIIGSAVVKGEKTITEGTVDLATEGSTDWAQFCNNNLATYAQKNIEKAVITNVRAINSVSERASDGKFKYINSDDKGVKPINGTGTVAKGLDNGFEFDLPCNVNTQNLKVYTGVWGGDVTFELLVNDIVQYTDTFGKDSSSGAISQCFDVKYYVPNAFNKVSGRLYCTKNVDFQWGGCSVIIQAITLSDSDEAMLVPTKGISVNVNEKDLLVGDSFDLVATIKPADATNQNVTWESSDENIATVDESGKVTALKEGQTTITVTTEEGNYQATCTVHVTEKIAGITNKSDLEALLAYAQSQKEDAQYEHVVPAVKQEFEKALADGQIVFNTEDAPKETIDQAYKELLKFVWMLGYTGDTSELSVVVDVAKQYDLTLYTPETAQALSEALAAAEEVLGNENALQEEITTAKDNLQSAIDGLKLKVDKSFLEQKIKEADAIDLDKFLTVGKDNFIQALADAKVIFEKEDATEQEVTDAYKMLQNAIFLLREKPDKSKLDQLIKDSKAMPASKYTEETYAVLEKAITSAEKVYQNAESTKEEVAQEEQNLVKAIDQLEEVQQPEKPGWKKQEDGTWRYLNKDQKYATNCWQKIDQKWYRFDKAGYMMTGWTQDKAKTTWYYLKSNGVMATGWQIVDGKWYYFKSGDSGRMLTGWQMIGGNWYYLNAKGDMAVGWKLVDHNWYYLNTNGKMAVGWKLVDHKWYYLNANGKMAVGWKLVDHKWYYLNVKGDMAVGWKLIDHKWYYLNKKGEMEIEWVVIGGKWYYCNEKGIMLSSTSCKLKGKVYRFNKNGVCVNP